MQVQTLQSRTCGNCGHCKTDTVTLHEYCGNPQSRDFNRYLQLFFTGYVCDKYESADAR